MNQIRNLVYTIIVIVFAKNTYAGPLSMNRYSVGKLSASPEDILIHPFSVCEKLKKLPPPLLEVKLIHGNNTAAGFSKSLVEEANEQKINKFRVFCSAPYPVALAICETNCNSSIDNPFKEVKVEHHGQDLSELHTDLDVLVENKTAFYSIRCRSKGCDKEKYTSFLNIRYTNSRLFVYPGTPIHKRVYSFDRDSQWTQMVVMSMIYAPSVLFVVVCAFSMLMLYHFDTLRRIVVRFVEHETEVQLKDMPTHANRV